MNKLRITFAALSFVMTGAAFGQTPSAVAPRNPLLRPAPVLVFGSIDANHDGRISREEAQSNGELTGAWSTLDADRDAYLSAEEFGKWKAPASGAPPGKVPDSSSPQNATDAGSPASKPETAADKQDASTPETATDVR